MPEALKLFRRYVDDFVNRRDFSVLPEIMAADYTLYTSGLTISGRDTDYQAAVAKQLAQFPDLVFSIHELFVCGDQIGVRFSEHGASTKHAGSRAAWTNIAIYEVQQGRLARCTIEQDFYSRQRQLSSGHPIAIDPPALAPWDKSRCEHDPTAEAVVRDWLASGEWLDDPNIQIDDARSTGVTDRIIAGGTTNIDKIIAAQGTVAFHGEHQGPIADDVVRLTNTSTTPIETIYLSGLVTVKGSRVASGNIIRSRLGLYRKLNGA